MIDRREAERLSRSSEVIADVRRYGYRLLSVDSTLRIYKELGEPGGSWLRWEWPRRLAAIRMLGS